MLRLRRSALLLSRSIHSQSKFSERSREYILPLSSPPPRISTSYKAQHWHKQVTQQHRSLTTKPTNSPDALQIPTLSDVRQRLVAFTTGVSNLFTDCLECLHIEEAARNKRSAWTIDNHANLQRRQKRLRFTADLAEEEEDECAATHLIAHRLRLRRQNFDQFFPERPGSIPRKQMELQRQTQRALRTTLPTVLGYVSVPVVGNLFVVLGFAFPRILLSRHFHTESQIVTYAGKEYNSRLGGHGVDVADALWDGLMICGRSARSREVLMEWMGGGVLKKEEYDSAGPILRDVTPLSDAFIRGYNAVHDSETAELKSGGAMMEPEFTTLDAFHRECLVNLALATDAARFPYPVAMVVVRLMPMWVLKRWIRLTATIIALDDALIIEEIALQRERNGEGYKYCDEDLKNWSSYLTNKEVVDACLLRGLPCDSSKVTYSEMRDCLANHLSMISNVHRSIGSHWEWERKLNTKKNEEKDYETDVLNVEEWYSEIVALEMFTLYLPIIRFHLMKKRVLKER